MTDQPDESMPETEPSETPERRSAAIQQEIEEADGLLDPTVWESYGRQHSEHKED